MVEVWMVVPCRAAKGAKATLTFFGYRYYLSEMTTGICGQAVDETHRQMYESKQQFKHYNRLLGLYFSRTRA
jgi:hypothetical protein